MTTTSTTEPTTAPAGRLRPGSYTVTLAVTDQAGARWSVTALLVANPPRSRSARRLGRALAAVLLAGMVAATPVVLGWFAQLAHRWWPLVPAAVPYPVGLSFAVLATGTIVASTALTQLVTFLAGAGGPGRAAGTVTVDHPRGGGA